MRAFPRGAGRPPAEIVRRGLYTDPSVVRFLGWDEPIGESRGLPIGNLTSQWWGNHYLDGLDHFVKRELRVPSYQRYMDDFALFDDDRARLLAARARTEEWLARERRLELKEPAARPRRSGGWHPYLGYRVSRCGIEPGARMRSRAGPLVAARASAGSGVEESIHALASAWMFG